MVNQKLFSRSVLYGLRYFGLLVVLFFLSRLIFLITFGNWVELKEYKVGVLKAFLTGARFDVSAICYVFLPVVLLWLAAIWIPKKKEVSFLKYYRCFIDIYLFIALIVLLSLQIIDYFYYQFFQSHIDILFFGIFKDDTVAVLNSVWTDYPIFKIITCYLLAIFIFVWLNKKSEISNRMGNTRTLKMNFWLLLLVFPLFFIGMRGSIGVFTLKRDHTNISSNSFVNSLCYNAVYALKYANSELKNNSIEPDYNLELTSNGYASIGDLSDKYDNFIVESYDDELLMKTKYDSFIDENPPNVVFVLMESMSNHYFELNSKDLNVLGDLADELPNLYYFKNGLSAFNGTIYTLENLLVNTPKNIISQSAYYDVSFSSSVARPFKQKGYDTSFLTGANTSWRNVDKFIMHQGFDRVEGKPFIEEKYPDASSFAWGVHDEYLFDYIRERLEDNKEKPQFIFALTISNHTPFEVPNRENLYPIKMNEEIRGMIRVDEKMAYDNFYAHQYAANHLARFIRDIRESEFGENTIVVATGDHNIRQVFEYSDVNAFLKKSVPILFYIPEKYKPSYFDENLYVSHKDIFPTIFNLSLSNQKYVYSGDDMFKKSEGYRFALNNYDFIADSLGVVTMEGAEPVYYKWENGSRGKLKLGSVKEKHAIFMMEKMKSFKTLQTTQLYLDIENSRGSKKMVFR
ncbi:LTA synthase family protein [Myroides guanonis]|uniref:Phosphoglycerol transferase MdoB n=1 Tax=Myroides guanonis TaxID=1150112 RepID=A0A1I3TIE2_9FLAO|nr:alkaline phosphatase family protein [Myroides guanonis]SFJ70179.1 Phosphoglycerol transferase MdoB [Myroides guanonis]